MASFVVRTLADLGPALVLAPERQRAATLAAEGVPLGELVVERRERLTGREAEQAVVLDTTHARDGVLDLQAAARTAEPARSAKKRVRAGDVLVSRLRPYLRQVAFVHPAALEACAGRVLACSTEFYVLGPRPEGATLPFLLPFLLSAEAQAVLAAGQEGGHHPRVPRETLFALRVPRGLVRARRRMSREVAGALERIYEAAARWQGLICAEPVAP